MKTLLCLCVLVFLKEATAVTNSCQAQGFDGCCDPNTHLTCHGDGNNEDCFCDQVCFTFNDCCDDISAIGCFSDASSPSATAPPSGTCSDAGYQTCCDIANEANCYGSPPNCYCDQDCYDFDDCCADIADFCDAPDNPTLDKGSCASKGYTQCCTPNTATNETCHGSDNECFCDEICYNYGDCCEDIEEINCLKDEESSCKEAGFVGCCDPSDPPCYSQTGKNTCYCDEICYDFGDCCNDISDIGCVAPTATPTASTGSCINAGHTVCCSTSNSKCLGDDGLCHCNAECYEVGDCCTDIDQLGCTTPTPTLAEGSCKTAGFDACCPGDNPGGCLGEPATCFCDQACYSFGDCCSDVASIGCIQPSVTPVENGSCLAAGYSGCCDPSGGAACQGKPANCYCDAVCHSYGDCCNDIFDVGCVGNTPSGSCKDAGLDECCPGDDDTCLGTGANCYCDQACSEKNNCCDDIDQLKNCQASAGKCADAGFEACCNIANEANCYGSPADCYCDQACYNFDDCCSDITDVCDAPDNPTLDQGSCASKGYTQCCVPNSATNETCHGSDNQCYCDEICYNYGDCCDDIEDINCLKDEESSCKAAGFVGCCNPDEPPCYSQTGKNTCYCDEICFDYGDCCNDIADIGCIAPSTTPTASEGSCVDAGHTTCCTTSIFNSCLGSNGLCHCNEECFEVGDCCPDIEKLGCTTPTATVPEGSCKTAGFSTCCPNDNPGGCLGEPATCYCDQDCFGFGDCCNDVTSIGCIKPSVTPVENGSCLAAGYSGCCDPSGGAACKGKPENCYCDAICHSYGDCCNDIFEINCTPQSGSCKDAGRDECCPGDDDTCLGTGANCYCDQACSEKNNCCDDIGKLKNCQAGVPGKVSNLTVTSVSDTSLSVSWAAPIESALVSTYTISIQKYYGGRTNLSFADDTTTTVITGLSPYQPYNVSVYAGNFKGNGEGNTVVKFTKEGVPSVAVTGITAKKFSSDKSKLVVSWTPLTLTQARGFITEYTVAYNTAASRRRRTSDTIVHVDKNKSSVIIDVSESKTYEVSVTCYTSKGAGPSSKKIREEDGGSSSGPVKSGVSAGLIVGAVLGAVGLLILVIIITLVIVLVVYKVRGKKDTTTGRRYQKLFINADYDDDDDD